MDAGTEPSKVVIYDEFSDQSIKAPKYKKYF